MNNTTPIVLTPRIAAIRQQIAAGTYETPARLDGAVGGVLDAIREPAPLPIRGGWTQVFGCEGDGWE